MHKRVFFIACLFMVFWPASARADSASIDATLNLTSGRQQQSTSRSTALPNVPIPTVGVRFPFKRFTLAAEGMPPIGPVPYNGGYEATKLSYLDSELRWRTFDGRFEIGAGTTLINQVTYYDRSVFTPQQSSRVAGFRMSVSAQLEQTLRARTIFRIAGSPSMHGLQITRLALIECHGGVGFSGGSCAKVYREVHDAELASLVDILLSRTQRAGTLGFSYGVRYINYAARFTFRDIAADRERLLMPFAGITVSLGGI